jgi:hypothetical protein
MSSQVVAAPRVDGVRASFFIVVCLAIGCGSSSAKKACTPGQSVACIGVGACEGGQVCNADGTAYGACQCGTNPGTGGSSAGAGGKGGSGGTGGGAGGSIGGAGGTGGATGGAGGSAGQGGTGQAQATWDVSVWDVDVWQ